MTETECRSKAIEGEVIIDRAGSERLRQIVAEAYAAGVPLRSVSAGASQQRVYGELALAAGGYLIIGGPEHWPERQLGNLIGLWRYMAPHVRPMMLLEVERECNVEELARIVTLAHGRRVPIC